MNKASSLWVPGNLQVNHLLSPHSHPPTPVSKFSNPSLLFPPPFSFPIFFPPSLPPHLPVFLSLPQYLTVLSKGPTMTASTGFSQPFWSFKYGILAVYNHVFCRLVNLALAWEWITLSRGPLLYFAGKPVEYSKQVSDYSTTSPFCLLLPLKYVTWIRFGIKIHLQRSLKIR